MANSGESFVGCVGSIFMGLDPAEIVIKDLWLNEGVLMDRGPACPLSVVPDQLVEGLQASGGDDPVYHTLEAAQPWVLEASNGAEVAVSLDEAFYIQELGNTFPLVPGGEELPDVEDQCERKQFGCVGEAPPAAEASGSLTSGEMAATSQSAWIGGDSFTLGGSSGSEEPLSETFYRIGRMYEARHILKTAGQMIERERSRGGPVVVTSRGGFRSTLAAARGILKLLRETKKGVSPERFFLMFGRDVRPIDIARPGEDGLKKLGDRIKRALPLFEKK